MGLIERRTGKPFRSIKAQATESEDEMYVGPGWIRMGRNVNCPMADAQARKEVRVPRAAYGADLLRWAVFLIVAAAIGLYWILK